MRFWFSFILLPVLSGIFFTAPASYAAPAGKAPKTAKTVKTDPAAARKKEAERKFKKAESALYAQKTENALPVLSRLCEEEEYLRACSLLGFAYTAGRYGVGKDFKTGLEWYEKCAAKEKNFFCHNEIGRLHYQQSDYDKAFTYYQKGAKAGDSKAEYGLGRLYLEGKGIPANAEKALYWFRRAAHDSKKPNKAAQCTLVEMSYYGIGMRSSVKDTNYWLKKCDNPFIRALRSFYGHGVSKDRDLARRILQQAKLNEALKDWNDFSGASRPSVGKKTIRDQSIPEDCAPRELLFGARRRSPRIETYAVKIFHPDYYRTFDVRDGFSEKSGGADQTFEACGRTFYTTLDNRRLFNRALQQKAVIKISVYQNACLGAEMTGICDLNLPWRERETEE